MTRLRISKDTRDNGLRPLKRDGEIWDTVVRRLIDYYEKHEGDERYATPEDVREIVREECRNG